jgi:transposase
MTYFFRKKLKNKFYLFQGESKADGKGNAIRVKSKYLGSYDELCEYFKELEVTIQKQAHYEYGLSHSLWELSKQLGMTPILQNYLKKNRNDSYVSSRVIVMIINRLVEPCAKYSIEKWYGLSHLSKCLNMPIKEVASQKVYRSMDILEQSSIEIEDAMCKVISTQEKINLDHLYVDFTNQESYSNNEESELLKCGHNKRGFDELNQINLALCCDTDFGIPFFHKTYPGNYNDKQMIQEYAPELRTRLDKIGQVKRVTLIIDRGINGKNNFELLLSNKFDYIGGLIEKEYPIYFDLPKSKLRKKYEHKRDKKENLNICYTSFIEDVYNSPHKILVFFNQENYAEKEKILDISIKKYIQTCENYLEECKDEIAKNTFQSRINNIEKIKNSLYKLNKKLFHLINIEIKSYQFELTWSITQNKSEIMKAKDKFGIHVLFTNKLNYTDKQILDYFFNKDYIEKNNQILKANAYTNRHIILGPLLHSKDTRIETHVYTCILALQLYQILRKRIKQSKLDTTTQNAIEELEQITCYYTKIAGKNENIKFINPITEQQKKVLNAINLNIFS